MSLEFSAGLFFALPACIITSALVYEGVGGSELYPTEKLFVAHGFNENRPLF